MRDDLTELLSWSESNLPVNFKLKSVPGWPYTVQAVEIPARMHGQVEARARRPGPLNKFPRRLHQSLWKRGGADLIAMSGDAKDDDIRFEPERFTETCLKIYGKWKVSLSVDEFYASDYKSSKKT